MHVQTHHHPVREPLIQWPRTQISALSSLDSIDARGLAAPDMLINALRGPKLVKLLTRSDWDDPPSADRRRLSSGIGEELVVRQVESIFSSFSSLTSPQTAPPQVDSGGAESSLGVCEWFGRVPAALMARKCPCWKVELDFFNRKASAVLH